MNIREVAEAPKEYEGMAWEQEGVEVIHATLTSLGQKVEMVKHKDTYYIIKC